MANRFKQKEEQSPEVKEFAEARTLTSAKEVKEDTVDFKTMKKKNDKYIVYLRLDKELEKPIKELAKENGVSVAKLGEILIRKALKKNEI